MPSSGLDGRLTGSGQELPVKLVANVSPATASHVPLALQGCQAVLFRMVAEFSGWGMCWAGQGSEV
eukprot:1160627-Pelagomonas_calceolata.AAC.4